MGKLGQQPLTADGKLWRVGWGKNLAFCNIDIYNASSLFLKSTKSVFDAWSITL